MVIGLLALVFLIVSFLTDVPRGRMLAGIVVGLVVAAVPAGGGLVRGAGARSPARHQRSGDRRCGGRCGATGRRTEAARDQWLSRDGGAGRGRLVALGIALAVLVPLGYLWATSLVPGYYIGDGHGVRRLRRRAAGGHAHHHGGMSVTDLTGPTTGTPDVAVTLTARKQKFTAGQRGTVDGFTLNGTSPGPLIRARVGDVGPGDAGERVRARRCHAALARDRRTRTPRTGSPG